MIILLTRHGIAEDLPIISERSDFDRELTEKGRKRLRDVAEVLRRGGFIPTHYASSPRVRAMQTGQEIRAHMGARADIVQVAALDFAQESWPGFVAAANEVVGGDPDAVLLATSHEPVAGNFIAKAVTAYSDGFQTKKGSVAALKWHGPASVSGADLMFYITPKFARSMLGED